MAHPMVSGVEVLPPVTVGGGTEQDVEEIRVSDSSVPAALTAVGGGELTSRNVPLRLPSGEPRLFPGLDAPAEGLHIAVSQISA